MMVDELKACRGKIDRAVHRLNVGCPPLAVLESIREAREKLLQLERALISESYLR